MRLHNRGTKSEYLGLLVYEALLVQEIEIHSRKRGYEGEVAALKLDKEEVSIKRKRLALVLKNKRAADAGTSTAAQYKTL
ncbi:hypothetical protein FZW96_11910 [Bacillus sp. BGMRC 2118]|nr:hypothetical protein FZW96_11910 [Bacillus sp. BGMRC 2118]